jgi:chromosome segregation ATPase
MFWRRNGGAQATEGWQAAQVRVASLEEALRAVQQELRALQDRQLAYTATIAEATDKLHRLVERGRKYAASRERADGSGDGADDDFWEAYERRRGVAIPREP